MLTTPHENKFKIALKKKFSRGTRDAFVQFISIHLDPIPRVTATSEESCILHFFLSQILLLIRY